MLTMSMVNIRESIPEDIFIVANDMRHEDSIEVIAQGYEDSHSALTRSFEKSKYRLTIEYKGAPVGMFGLIEADMNTANVWLLGTPGLAKMKKSFMQLSKNVISEMLTEYPILFAQVDGRYAKTRSWLEWLGAKDNGEYALNGIGFNNFVFRR